jgi:hypothetical protein
MEGGRIIKTGDKSLSVQLEARDTTGWPRIQGEGGGAGARNARKNNRKKKTDFYLGN